MASGGHVLQQQKTFIEAKIKGLVNQDLKEICKAYDYQVSGTKAVLQKRCLESEPYTYTALHLEENGVTCVVTSREHELLTSLCSPREYRKNRGRPEL